MRPVLSLLAARLFCEFVDYARRHCTSPDQLPSVASDVMDGWKLAYDPEVIELTQRGLIKRITDGCGKTWHLTPLGVRLLVRGEA